MMNRRTFAATLVASAAALRPFRSAFGQSPKFEPDWKSIAAHQVPDWYQNAKLGIFIHWGLYSVPAWATTSGELGKVDPSKWFTDNAYAEWYLNTLRIKGSPGYEHHIATYGKDFDYYQFAPIFNRNTAKWDPDKWAAVFKRTGARYAVLTTKHHDGFRLWPSTVENPHRSSPEITATRDLAGELTAAVRNAGLKMGLYYSGGLDWTFTEKPIVTMQDLMARVPQTEDYARYADAHWNELIDRYQPAVMWNDINYPKAGKIPELFAHYYNSVPQGVINNRFGVDFSDFTTPEYAKYDKITPKKWESCRGLGYSFGYNQAEGPEQVIAPDKLVWLLVDIVSKNGNLLLNIGPRSDGSISDIQMDRLDKLGAWLAINGEGIFDSRPWVKASSSPDIRFTRKENSLYVYTQPQPAAASLSIPGIRTISGTTVRVLGATQDSEFKQLGQELVVSTTHTPKQSNYAVGLRITPVPDSI
jgi:alpha-L-fucosidase